MVAASPRSKVGSMVVRVGPVVLCCDRKPFRQPRSVINLLDGRRAETWTWDGVHMGVEGTHAFRYSMNGRLGR
jgi:hypothetical protein